MPYHLCKVNAKGDETLLGTFEDEATLLAAIPEKPVLKIQNGNIIASFSLAGLESYRVKSFTMNTLRTEEPEIHEPVISLTVQSESDYRLTYGVAIDSDGKIIACTCPSFQYAKTDDPCKHMMAIIDRPWQYGLSLLGGKFVIDRYANAYSVPAAPLPGHFYFDDYRLPGKRRSW